MFASMKSANAQKGFQLGIEGSPQMSWQMNKGDNNNAQFKSFSTLSSSSWN